MNNINYNFFLEKIKETLDYLGISEDYNFFQKTLALEPKYSFKLNTTTSQDEIKQEFKNVKIVGDICYIEEKPKYSQSKLYNEGKIYPQEPSSIIWGQVFDQIYKRIGIEGVILDLCAAPGGKTLSIANTIKDTESILISNEIDGNRCNVLVENVDKWKTQQTICTQVSAKKFGEFPLKANFICIDAPCSGEGMIRKLNNINNFFKSYDKNLIKKCKNRQIEIIKDVSPFLVNNGFLIYSTCTYNLDENEEVIKYIQEKFDYSVISLDFVDIPKGVLLTKDGFLRFFPHRFDGEGLFISLLQKNRHYETEKETISLWKKQRTDRPEILKETKNAIIFELKNAGIDLENNYILKYNIISNKPTDLYLVNKKIYDIIMELNENNFKLKYIGKKIATYGKNIKKSIKVFI